MNLILCSLDICLLVNWALHKITIKLKMKKLLLMLLFCGAQASAQEGANCSNPKIHDMALESVNSNFQKNSNGAKVPILSLSEIQTVSADKASGFYACLATAKYANGDKAGVGFTILWKSKYKGLIQVAAERRESIIENYGNASLKEQLNKEREDAKTAYYNALAEQEKIEAARKEEVAEHIRAAFRKRALSSAEKVFKHIEGDFDGDGSLQLVRVGDAQFRFDYKGFYSYPRKRMDLTGILDLSMDKIADAILDTYRIEASGTDGSCKYRMKLQITGGDTITGIEINGECITADAAPIKFRSNLTRNKFLVDPRG